MICPECGKFIVCACCGETEYSQNISDGHKFVPKECDHNRAKDIQDAYVDGVCPDCQEPIPDTVVEGEGCKNCGHVFWLDDSDESINGYYAE